MKKIIIILFCLLSACSQPEAYDSQHHPIKLSDYRGKWLIVNYWATWCQPCLAEMPALNAFYHSHQNSMIILGVNFDGLGDEDLNKLAKKRGIDYPLLSNLNNAEIKQQDFSVLPVSFVFNPKGKLIKVLRGPQTEQSLSIALRSSK